MTYLIFKWKKYIFVWRYVALCGSWETLWLLFLLANHSHYPNCFCPYSYEVSQWYYTSDGWLSSIYFHRCKSMPLDLNIYSNLRLCYKMNVVFVISSRDAKLVYGCDVEERRRYGRKARKRAISERTVTASPVIFSYTDEHLAKLHLRKTKVWHEISLFL